MKKYKLRIIKIILSFSVLVNLPVFSVAEEAPGSSWLAFSVPAELQNDYDYRSDTAGNQRNNMFLKLEPEATIQVVPVPGLSLFAHGVLEQVVDAAPYEDRYFKDEGFYIQDLFARYEAGAFDLRAGKMNPGFGVAWDKAHGIYGRDMAEDYELAERIALVASLGFEPQDWGSHRITAGTFFLDTSPLQNTIASRSRGTLDRADGGVSNTADFSSFNLVLEGGKFPALPDVSYHLAFVSQAEGVDGTENETGFAAAVTTGFKLGGDVVVTPLLEIVRLDDVGGTKDKESRYGTASLLTEWKGWNFALAYTRRRTEEPGVATLNDYQIQTSIGYTFDSGWTADLGWKRLKEGDDFTDRVGFLITYQFDFKG